MTILRPLCIALALVGCNGPVVGEETGLADDTGGDPTVDDDEDGFAADTDCDDSDPAVNPDATEVPYDGVDNDCSADTLDDDLDADGFVLADDCDDEDAAVNPDATEVAGDGVDNDCSDATCFQSGFELTAVDWPIPDEFGPEAFDVFADFLSCIDETPTFTVVDLDGDGLQDIVVTEDPCDDVRDVGISKWLLFKNNGAGHDATPVDWPIPADYGPEALDATTSANDCTLDTPAFILFDLDGDGLQDLVITEAPCDDVADTVGVSEWLVYANDGAGFAATAVSWPIPDEFGPEALDVTQNLFLDCGTEVPSFLTTDLDGDGLADLVVTEDPCDDARGLGVDKWYLYKNNGAGFDTTPIDWGIPTDYGPEALDQYGSPNNCGNDTPAFGTTDLDGDGLPDLIITEAPCDDQGDTLGIDMWHLHRNLGTGFDPAPLEWSIPTAYGPEALDQLGGANDCAGETPAYYTIDANRDDLLDLLVTEAPCDNQGDEIGVTRWVSYISDGADFAAAGVDFAIPQDYGPEALDVLSSGRDCGLETPAFNTTDIDHNGLLDLVVTEDPCDTEDIGDVRWLVYHGACDL